MCSSVDYSFCALGVLRDHLTLILFVDLLTVEIGQNPARRRSFALSERMTNRAELVPYLQSFFSQKIEILIPIFIGIVNLLSWFAARL